MSRWRVLSFGVMTAVSASGYGVLFTVLDDFRDRYGIVEYWLGVLVGMGFFAAFVSQVFIAPLADRGHARKLLVGGLLLNAIGLVGLGFGSTLPVLLGARLVSGLGIGMAIPAVRRIVVTGDPERLGSNLGLLMSADVSGFAIGPVIAAVLVGPIGLPAPFLVISTLIVGMLPFALRVPIAEGDDPSTPDNPEQHRLAFDLLRSRALVAGIMMGAAVFLMIGTFDALWSVVLDDLDASDFVANIGITIFALPLIFLGSIGGALSQRVGPFRLGPLGLAVGAVFMVLYGLMPTGVLMVAVGTAHALTDGLTVASTGVAVAMAAPADRQAGAQGLLGAIESATAGATAILAGALYTLGGRLVAYSVAAVAMVVLAAGAYYLAGPAHRGRRTLEQPVVVHA